MNMFHSLTWLRLVVGWAVSAMLVLGYSTLSAESLEALTAMTVADRLSVDGTWLSSLLVERVSGTKGNAAVRDMMVHHFIQLGWHVELDAFEDDTPVGRREFVNIVATMDRGAAKSLVLAAHYDSKLMPNQAFIGATDSAVPCAILLDLAAALNDLLHVPSPDTSNLQIILFDGEEAFHSWTETDSIYGARHLAEKWANNGRLASMDVMVLLDLLGTPNPAVHNYHPQTSDLFDRLEYLEKRLWKRKHFETVTHTAEPLHPILVSQSSMRYLGYHLQDDHVPFLQRGIPVLHFIPYPFPDVWHRPEDNASCLDPPSIRNLALLFRSFVAEYLELRPVWHSEL